MTIVVDPTHEDGGGVTLGSLIQRVRRDLTHRQDLNVLDDDIDDVESSLKLSYSLSGVSRGVEMTIGNETLYVWEADTGTRSITVMRGYGGTDVDGHNAGSIVTIGGYSRAAIVDAINDELAGLSGKGLFQMKTVAIDGFNSATSQYSIPELAGARVYDVEFLDFGPSREWVRIPGWRQSSIDDAVVVPFHANSYNVRVLYKAGFEKLSNDSDDVQSTSGLQAEAADVLVKGACYRLLLPQEASRNDIYGQGDTRRPSEVPAGAVSNSANAFKASRDERIVEEKDRLRRRFPERKAGW